MPLRAAAVCGLLAPVTFVVGLVAGDLSQPEAFSPVDDNISDLGALTAESPWLYNQVAANVTGLLVLVFALGLWGALGGSLTARLGVILLALVGVGMFLDGIFRLDCRGIDAGCDNTSWHSTVHGKEVTMCGRHQHRRRRGWRAPNREELLKALEERQKDLEQEIADIHDVLRRLRDEGAATATEPAPSI